KKAFFFRSQNKICNKVQKQYKTMNNNNKNSHPTENHKTPLILTLKGESQADEIRIFHWIM
ncbi:hypothetical protein, partial [Morganella morganii]|uniref:hypothetical protein n=1 Tax=Morganella morganii TaxID=582 RepID=UPI0021D30AE8